MKEMQFSVQINAAKEMVWNALWQDDSFRSWAGIIDPGTYMAGELEAGNQVQFISAVNGYGVTSLVAEMRKGEYLLLKHKADTQGHGEQVRDNEWTGGEESYTLAESGGTTQF